MSDETCWTLIEAAGEGDSAARDEFAARYLPAVRAYLLARWGSGGLADLVDDAQQEVFVECLKHGGILERVQRGTQSGFRGYLYGVVRNVANRVEERRRHRSDWAGLEPPDLDLRLAEDRSLSKAFDRAFAIGVLRSALHKHRAAADALGGRGAARFELLRQRFDGGKTIAEIAKERGEDAAYLHREYATARKEFHVQLRRIVASHHPAATTGDIDRECEHLVELVDN